jgi:glycine cleavage system transcriptional repressor
MRLAITTICQHSNKFLPDLISAVSNCDCQIVEFRTSQLSNVPACYLLAEGEWNHIAKLETFLDHLQQHPGIDIQTSRPPKTQAVEGLAYVLETLSLYRGDILQDLIKFIQSRNIHIEEASSFCQQSAFTKSQMLIIKLTIIIPPEVRILSLRDELLEFCNNINLDAIFEPVKHL